MTSKKFVNITGVSEGGVAAVVSKLPEAVNSPLLVVTENADKARKLALDFEFFASRNGKIYILDENTDAFFNYEARDKESSNNLISVLCALLFEEESTVFLPASMLFKKLPKPEEFKRHFFTFEVGEELDLQKLKKRLVDSGYERAHMVEACGQFSVRASIVDIFAPNLDKPVRIELFDTVIESLKFFDPTSQRTIKKIQKINVMPSSIISGSDENFKNIAENVKKAYEKVILKLNKKEENKDLASELEKTEDMLVEMFGIQKNFQLAENYIEYFYDECVNIWNYIDDNGICVIDDFDRVRESIESTFKLNKTDFVEMLSAGKIIEKDFTNLADLDAINDFYENTDLFIFTPFLNRLRGIKRRGEIKNVEYRSQVRFNGRMEPFVQALKVYLNAGYYVTISCNDDESKKTINELLLNYDIHGKITVRQGTLSTSFEFPTEKLAYISQDYIFGKATSRTRNSKKGDKTLAESRRTFIELKKGDYVVHEEFGIGKFVGIEEMSIESEKKDYLKIKYAGTDVVYLPVENMGVIQKYVGADTENIRVSKLGGAEWKTAKAKAKLAVEDMAQKLLEISATRSIEAGFAFSKDGKWQEDFESDFPYQETDDQLRAIKEIKKDMEKPVPMDRLLCGDVGVGKTEVAARALFKCIADGKQAAVLVPTTLLANQHYITLKERFAKFPCNLDLLCRFRSEKEQENTVKLLSSGQVDLVIGTHRILSEDVKFKNLGLLVIDEEQRFGVKDKEKLKMLSKNVDVLSMSATPIPRTLHMSLVGIKNMSVIEEPPQDRYPVQTYVVEQEDEILKSAIMREVNRGGQVYVIYNRVVGLEKLAQKLRTLLPELSIESAHGRMKETTLENRMLKFMSADIQVLVATTIMEAGIDIPNANTMIIIDADNLGLSQLYQLRGRVGRSSRIAYAYLMFKKDKVISEIAQKRLRSIKEFTEFGAGFKVAMKDLEIRGAGNILGASQHGHIAAIGYELYCKLVDDAILRLSGNVEDAKPSVETVLEFKVSAYIPKGYIEDEAQKIQMYRKIADISSFDDRDEVKDELIDRFGKIPKDTLNLIDLALIRSIAKKYGIATVKQDNDFVWFEMANGRNLEISRYALLSEKFGENIMIYASSDVKIRYKLQKKGSLLEIIEFLKTLDEEVKSDAVQ
ncbi:MAG: transcription-repair coupling factor [Eubacteriales bacterium]